MKAASEARAEAYIIIVILNWLGALLTHLQFHFQANITSINPTFHLNTLNPMSLILSPVQAALKEVCIATR